VAPRARLTGAGLRLAVQQTITASLGVYATPEPQGPCERRMGNVAGCALSLAAGWADSCSGSAAHHHIARELGPVAHARPPSMAYAPLSPYDRPLPCHQTRPAIHTSHCSLFVHSFASGPEIGKDYLRFATPPLPSPSAKVPPTYLCSPSTPPPPPSRTKHFPTPNKGKRTPHRRFVTRSRFAVSQSSHALRRAIPGLFFSSVKSSTAFFWGTFGQHTETTCFPASS
jgi:hypothetical protein